MGTVTDLERIRHVLRLAQRQINQQQPDLAIESLRRIKDDVEGFPDTPEWVEHPLLLGEAFTAKHSKAAKSFLQDAEQRIARLREPEPDFNFRLHDHLGYYYQEVERKRSRARMHYEQAKNSAVKVGNGELTARTQLRIIHIDLQIDNDPEQGNLKAIRRVAREHNFLYEDQLAAWHVHLGELTEGPTSLLYARGFTKRDDQYFFDLLSSVRLRQ